MEDPEIARVEALPTPNLGGKLLTKTSESQKSGVSRGNRLLIPEITLEPEGLERNNRNQASIILYIVRFESV